MLSYEGKCTWEPKGQLGLSPPDNQHLLPSTHTHSPSPWSDTTPALEDTGSSLSTKMTAAHLGKTHHTLDKGLTAGRQKHCTGDLRERAAKTQQQSTQHTPDTSWSPGPAWLAYNLFLIQSSPPWQGNIKDFLTPRRQRLGQNAKREDHPKRKNKKRS